MKNDFEILLIDDDDLCLPTFQQFFQRIDAQVLLLSDEEKALKQIKNTVPLLFLISLKLACAKEWNLLKELNQTVMPIIGLVDNDDPALMQEGKKRGISGYLVKPLDLYQLNAYFPVILFNAWSGSDTEKYKKERRFCSDRRDLSIGRRRLDQLEKIDNSGPDETLFHFGPFIIDTLKKHITRSGNIIELSPKEYNLFFLLLKNKERVVTTEEIIAQIWPKSHRASEEDVKQYIYLLRKKIELDPSHPCFIQTLKGFGYMLSYPEA